MERTTLKIVAVLITRDIRQEDDAASTFQNNNTVIFGLPKRQGKTYNSMSKLVSGHSRRIFTHLNILHLNNPPAQQKVHFPILILKAVSDPLLSSAFISPASLYHFNLALSRARCVPITQR
jgi:hypothetical protein